MKEFDFMHVTTALHQVPLHMLCCLSVCLSARHVDLDALGDTCGNGLIAASVVR